MQIRDVRPDEHTRLGQLMVEVYSQLDGFPSPADQSAYYDMLANIGSFTTKRGARVIVAVSTPDHLVGGVERLGFQRSPDLDFMQQGFPVHGFRLRLPM